MLVSPTQATTAVAKNLSPLSQITQTSYTGISLGSEGHIGNPVLAATPFQPVVWPICGQPWPYLPAEDGSHHWKGFRNEDFRIINDKKVMISVKDRDLLAIYYTKAFENLQQTNCRILAKSYIKLVEPRKQVNYPYNGRKIVTGTTRQLDPNMTKPPWWPSKVSHREPDHLPKSGRRSTVIFTSRIYLILNRAHSTSSLHPSRATHQSRNYGRKTKGS